MSPQSGTTPSSGAQSSPPSSGAIPPASGTPSLTITSTTLPTDRLDAINQALSELCASQADYDRFLVKQTSNTSSLSDHIGHINAKLETFADELLNDIKQANDSHEVVLAALNNTISQLQNLLKAKLVDKDDGLGSGSSSLSLSEEEEEKEKEKRKPSLLTAETLPTFHGKPNKDPNIFLTSFDCYAATAGWSHQDYILHFEGQLRDNADVVRC
ncbi:hypothetical protein QOT17_017017 [Balamuthia mandrillaris]